MGSRLHAYAALILMAPVAAGTALAADANQPDTNAAICAPNRQVDKEKLAAALIAAYPVSTAYLSIGKNAAPLTSHRALAQWLLDKRAAEKAGGAAVCSGDSCNVDRLASELNNLLDGKNSQFKASANARPDRFFSSSNTDTLTCAAPDTALKLSPPSATGAVAGVAAATGTAAVTSAAPGGNPAAAGAPAPKPEPTLLDHVRVRGNPDQLSIDRSNAAGYASVERARVSLANDDVAQSRTNDVVVYTGYSFDKRPFGEPGSTYEAVPYIGFKQNRVTTYPDGVPSVATTRTTAVGMLSAFHFAHPGTDDTEDLTARPDYLINNTDGSRLLTANFTYTPVRKGKLNDFIRWSNGLAFKPILVGQSRNGIYINRGDPTVEQDHLDFIRLGAQAGFTLASTNPALPFDFTTTFTGLKALKGAQSIHYWKAVLTYNLNQNIGLSLDYSNGTLPDTADREKKWSLGLTSKF